MATALDVAKYLIYLADNEAEPDLLNHMRVQKLLYYVQGWSLAERGTPMFGENIEAWVYGPVVPMVYNVLKRFGSGSISSKDFEGWDLTDDEMEFVQRVWEAYKPFSAIELYRRTHREAPWKNARKGLPPGEPSNVEITHESMRRYFTKQASGGGKT